MPTPDQQSTCELLKREAYDWLIRLTSGAATVADAKALNEWRDRSPAHAAAFAEVNALWDKIGPAGRSKPGSAGLAPRPTPRSMIGRRAMLTGATAASVGGLLVLRPPLDLWPSWSELAADYRTGVGERRQIDMAGGVLDMNTRTSLAIRPGEQQRAVELIAGEVVVTARSRQVEVVAADGRITANAASANIRLDGAHASVTCLDGEISVDCGGRHILLHRGQQVTYGGEILTEPASIDPAMVTAWSRGMLIFRNEPLERVVAEINRYRPGKLVLVDRKLATRRIEASFRLDRVDEVITLVREVYGARITQLPGGLVLLG